MRKLILFATLSAGLVSDLLGASASLSLHCLSPKFQPATARRFGLDYRLELTTGNDRDPANGEMAFGGDRFTGLFLLFDPTFFDTIPLDYRLGIPAFKDSNTNGIHDFYEISQDISAVTQGVYDDGFGGDGDITATWNRAQNSAAGTCRLNFPDLGLAFTHTFHIIQFEGALEYQRMGTNITANFSVSEAAAFNNRLTSSLPMQVLSTNIVGWTNGLWQWQTGGPVEFFPLPDPDLNNLTYLIRDGSLYIGDFFLSDGFPDTPLQDYLDWFALIRDPNDADADGIPDLSDSAAAVTPPKLSLRRENTRLLLTIEGTIGNTFDLERATSLNPANWTKTSSVTLSARPHTVELPAPVEPVLFWRLRSP